MSQWSAGTLRLMGSAPSVSANVSMRPWRSADKRLPWAVQDSRDELVDIQRGRLLTIARKGHLEGLDELERVPAFAGDGQCHLVRFTHAEHGIEALVEALRLLGLRAECPNLRNELPPRSAGCRAGDTRACCRGAA